MNIFQTWFLFHRSERHFHTISYRLLDLSSRMNALNERRKSIQKEIIALGKSSEACLVCQGLCCRGEYNHFTAIDYLMRRFSDKPIEEYGTLWKPQPVLFLLMNKFKEVLSRSQSTSQTPSSKCPDLTLTGCTFKPEDRPIRCVLWTCKTYRNSLSANELILIGKLTRELASISSETIKIFKSL
jgi:hypothetical protein